MTTCRSGAGRVRATAADSRGCCILKQPTLDRVSPASFRGRRQPRRYPKRPLAALRRIHPAGDRSATLRMRLANQQRVTGFGLDLACDADSRVPTLQSSIRRRTPRCSRVHPAAPVVKGRANPHRSRTHDRDQVECPRQTASRTSRQDSCPFPAVDHSLGHEVEDLVRSDFDEQNDEGAGLPGAGQASSCWHCSPSFPASPRPGRSYKFTVTGAANANGNFPVKDCSEKDCSVAATFRVTQWFVRTGR